MNEDLKPPVFSEQPATAEPKPRKSRKILGISIIAGVSLLIAIVMILLNLGDAAAPVIPGATKSSNKVYAADEVIKDAKDNLDKQTPGDITFMEHDSAHTIGPAYDRCYVNYPNSLGNYTQKELAFKDAKTQAWYITKNEYMKFNPEYYGENLNGDVAVFADIFADSQWAANLRLYLAESTIVDKKGEPLGTGATLEPITIDGVEYLQLNLKYKPSDNPKEQFCYKGENALVTLRVRADTKKIETFRVHLDSFADKDVVYEDKNTYMYESGPFSKFEDRFTAAGFSKQRGLANTATITLVDPNAPVMGR